MVLTDQGVINLDTKKFVDSNLLNSDTVKVHCCVEGAGYR